MHSGRGRGCSLGVSDAARWRWFRDPAIRYGIKFGLAGVVAVAISLTLRLKEPTWALFTVFVLMIAQYVGAVAEKSVFRLAGTVVGGFFGYVITAGLEQNPVLFLGATAILVGFCSAMFGQSRYPYAFLLCGLTTVVVTSNGMGNPSFSWQFALWRTEEVTVGVIVAVFVQSVLWPRYARVEFLQNLRAGFRDLAGVFETSLDRLGGGGARLHETPVGEFPKRIAALRGLLEFGARESRYFRERLASFFGLTVCLARIAFALGTVREAVNPSSPLARVLANEAGRIRSAIAEALRDLGDGGSDRTSRSEAARAIREAVDRYEEALVGFRREPDFAKVRTEDSMALAAFTLAVLEVRDQILEAHRILDALPADNSSPPRDPEPLLSPWPPPFWRHTGVRAGLGVALALFLANWLQPPGATMFVLGTWVFTALNAASPSGRGDQRIFHAMAVSIAVTGAVCVAVLAASPLLASYAVMNILLFAWLFVWGFNSFSTKGVTLPMQLAMLLIVGILGLNAQEPVAFPSVVGLFVGLSLALVVGAVIQRFIWPSLPQYEIRDRLVELADLARRILAEGSAALPLWQKTRCALIPGEVRLRIPHLLSPAFPDGTRQEISNLVGALESTTGHLIAGGNPLSAEQSPEAPFTELCETLDRELRAMAAYLALPQAAERPDPARLEAAAGKMMDWGAERRAALLAEGASPSRTLGILGAVDRYRLAALDLAAAARSSQGLAVRLSADPVL